MVLLIFHLLVRQKLVQMLNADSLSLYNKRLDEIRNVNHLNRSNFWHICQPWFSAQTQFELPHMWPGCRTSGVRCSPELAVFCPVTLHTMWRCNVSTCLNQMASIFISTRAVLCWCSMYHTVRNEYMLYDLYIVRSSWFFVVVLHVAD